MLEPDFIERLQAIIPRADLNDVLKSFSLDKRVCVRLNLLKQPSGMEYNSWIEEFKATLPELGSQLEPSSNYPHVFFISSEHRETISHHAWADDGRIYIQSFSSIIAGYLVEASAGQEVLDLAAAPGGKSSILAETMDNDGRLALVEPIRKRFFRLRANMERLGVHNAVFYMKDGRAIGNKVPERFDCVLLDAPCSSEARFRAGKPETWAHWSIQKVKECARKQRGLIRSAYKALKPGGTLVYSTCSFSPEENELIVQGLLRREPLAQVLPFELEAGVRYQVGLEEWNKRFLDEQIRHCRRILPSIYTDSLFIAKITKPTSSEVYDDISKEL